MSDSSTRGGRRPGAGRKPGTGTGTNPRITERVPADLADYCKAQQALSPGFLAGLVKKHKEAHMTLQEFSNKNQSVVVWFTSVGMPTGGEVALVEGDELPFSSDVEGEVSGEGSDIRWIWTGAGEPTDYNGNSVLQVKAYANDADYFQEVLEKAE